MSTILTFVTYPGGFRLDRVVSAPGDMAFLDVMCEQPHGALADALMEEADAFTEEDIKYYMALAEQRGDL